MENGVEPEKFKEFIRAIRRGEHSTNTLINALKNNQMFVAEFRRYDLPGQNVEELAEYLQTPGGLEDLKRVERGAYNKRSR